jgi:F-type H+-transporting ATPase subunit b
MLIDWFTVVAQLVNFLILLVALKYLLYDRIIEAMAERRRRFVEREEATDRLHREAQEESERIQADRKEIESNWENMIDEARREADQRRRELMEEARAQVETREQQWLGSIRARQDQLLVDLQRESGERAVAISRRAMADLAGADLEALMVDTFLDRLGRLRSGDDGEVMTALRSDVGDPVVVRTAFSLSNEQREAVRSALHDLLDDSTREIEWQLDPELIAGVLLETGARNVGWTIDTYLEGVEDRFADIIRHQTEAGSETVGGLEGQMPGVDAS